MEESMATPSMSSHHDDPSPSLGPSSVSFGKLKALQLFQTPCHAAITDWYNTQATKRDRAAFRQVTRSVLELGPRYQPSDPRLDETAEITQAPKYKVWADAVLHSEYRSTFYHWLAKAPMGLVNQFNHLLSTLLGRLHIHHITHPPPPKVTKTKWEGPATFRSSIRIGLDMNDPLIKESASKKDPVRRARSTIPWPAPSSLDQFQSPPKEMVLENLLTMKSRNKRRGDFTAIPYARLNEDFVEKPETLLTTANAFPRRNTEEYQTAHRLPLLSHKMIWHLRPVRGPLPLI